MRNNNKGITLIALIITIIVLLILAGVTIALITSNESAPEKAVQARTENQRGAAKDAATLLVAQKTQSYYEDKYVNRSSNVGTVLEYLKGTAVLGSKDGQTTGEYTVKIADNGTDNTTGKITVKKGTELMATGTVNVGGTITWDATPVGTNSEEDQSTSTKLGTTSLTKDNVGQFYGTKVAKGSNNIEYALYYIDFDGIFGEKGTVYLKALSSIGNTKINNAITDEDEQTAAVNIMKQLNPDWKVTNTTKTYNSLATNEKGTAYLCNVNNSLWSGLKNEFKTKFGDNNVNYVIGAPSVEMFVKSINQAGNLTGNAAVDARWLANKDPNNSSTTSPYDYSGYLYSITGTNTTSNEKYDYKTLTSEQQNSLTALQKAMYFSNVDYQWLASPCSYSYDNCVCRLNSNGELSSSYTDTGIESCPLISLKPGVQLTELTSE